jgi:hypothetical protein
MCVYVCECVCMCVFVCVSVYMCVCEFVNSPMRVQHTSQDRQIAAQATISTFFYQQQNPILSSFVSLDFFFLSTWAQFHQRSMRSFCAGRLTPVKYKPKT